MTSFNAIVIGSGQAGNPLAHRLADKGWTVALTELGVRVGGVTVDLPAVVARKNGIVLEWRQGQEKHTASRPNITLHRGPARFTAAHAVAVGNEQLTAEHI